MSLKLDSLSVHVVEDNPFMRSILKGILATLGVGTVVESESAEDALELLAGSSTPDILLIDWMMPGMDGIELVQKIRNDPDSKVPFVPVIMLTAFSEYENVVQARDVGVNEFLAKPVSVKGLVSRLDAVINKPRLFVRTEQYFGPCRRRRDMPFDGEDRRKAAVLSLEIGDDVMPPGLFDEPVGEKPGEALDTEWTVNEFDS